MSSPENNFSLRFFLVLVSLTPVCLILLSVPISSLFSSFHPRLHWSDTCLPLFLSHVSPHLFFSLIYLCLSSFTLIVFYIYSFMIRSLLPFLLPSSWVTSLVKNKIGVACIFSGIYQRRVFKDGYSSVFPLNGKMHIWSKKCSLPSNGWVIESKQVG